jgi:hypothetical protein
MKKSSSVPVKPEVSTSAERRRNEEASRTQPAPGKARYGRPTRCNGFLTIAPATLLMSL